MDDDDMVLSTSQGATVEYVFEHVSLEALAILTGISLVDLSIEFEPHLVRGED